MKSALIIIDMQQALFERDPKPFDHDNVCQHINRLSDKARAAGIPVMFLHYEKPGFIDYDSDPWQLIPALTKAASDRVIRKTGTDPFATSDLQEYLQSSSIDDLIICGYATEFCIDTTVRRATSLGYTVQLVADAHTTHDKTHLSAQQIVNHHNVTLSQAPTITAPRHGQVVMSR